VLGRPIDQAILVGLESQLRVLTCRLLESGFEFSASKVTSIHSTGDLITTRLRSFYEHTWGFRLTSRYSMSEVVGGAELCPTCNYYHCDPHIIGEVVDPFSGLIIESGVGVLVLTCLFPFVQKQPFIRYRTGDVVELGPQSCPVDELAFTLKGREIHAVLEQTKQGARPLLLGADVYDLLDQIPDIALSEFMQMFKSMSGISSHHDLGHLKYRITICRPRHPMLLRLEVELRYSHYLYRDQTAQLLERIRQCVMERHPHLHARVSTGDVCFEVMPALPGSLQQVQVDEVE